MRLTNSATPDILAIEQEARRLRAAYMHALFRKLVRRRPAAPVAQPV